MTALRDSASAAHARSMARSSWPEGSSDRRSSSVLGDGQGGMVALMSTSAATISGIFTIAENESAVVGAT